MESSPTATTTTALEMMPTGEVHVIGLVVHLETCMLGLLDHEHLLTLIHFLPDIATSEASKDICQACSQELVNLHKLGVPRADTETMQIVCKCEHPMLYAIATTRTSCTTTLNTGRLRILLVV